MATPTSKVWQPVRPLTDKQYELKVKPVSRYRIVFEGIRCLADMSEYVWYSPALLFLWGKFDNKNLTDLSSNSDFQIFWHKFDKPIFAGLDVGPDADWNHTLWAIRDSQWNNLVSWIQETVQFDSANKLLYRYAYQVLSVFDPYVVDRRAVVGDHLPKLRVNVFDVITNEGQYLLRESKKGGLPRAVSLPPIDQHRLVASRLFRTAAKQSVDLFSLYRSMMLSSRDFLYESREYADQSFS